MSLRYHIYDALWRLAWPWLRLRHGLRHRDRQDAARRWRERLGHVALPDDGRDTLWIHAVSVGETRAAHPLVRALRRRYPRLRLLVTHMTPTGLETGQRLWAHDPAIVQAYAPYDHSRWVRRFLERTRPRLGIVMETEIWPNWLRQAKRQGVPLVLANARLSERSFRRYRRFRWLLPLEWNAFVQVGAQSAADAQRLRALGARQVVVTGNLKFDWSPEPAAIALAHTWREAIGPRPVVVLASSREGEEARFLRAWEGLRQEWAEREDFLFREPPLLVIVPRHPERFDEVARLVERHGLRYRRRSASLPHPEDDVWLGDSMGELYAYYALADVAIIGGSWERHGGQNPLEALAAGTPPIVGPHTENFAEVVSQGVAARAIVQVRTPQEAIELAQRWIEQPDERAAAIAHGAIFLAAHRGATERTLALLAPWLEHEPGFEQRGIDGPVTPRPEAH